MTNPEPAWWFCECCHLTFYGTRPADGICSGCCNHPYDDGGL